MRFTTYVAKNFEFWRQTGEVLTLTCCKMSSSFVLFNATVPARLVVLARNDAGEPSVRSVGAGTTSETVSFATLVRDFIIDDPQLEWISEEAFLNGKAWWVQFQFSCKTGYSESCLEALRDAGIGDEEDGRGMVHVAPILFRHIGSRPKTCGRPHSLPYSAPTSPTTSPTRPLRKTPITVPMGDIPEVEEGEKMQFQESKSGETFTSLSFSDDEYEDGAEIEDETERLQAKLIAEVEAKEKQKRYLGKYTENFTDTVKSRVAVDSLVQFVTAASEFSFDYVMLIVLAAIIACVGLVTNNTGRSKVAFGAVVLFTEHVLTSYRTNLLLLSSRNQSRYCC